MDHLARMKRQYNVAEDRRDILAVTTLGAAIRALDEHEGHDDYLTADCFFCARIMDEAGRYWGAIIRAEQRVAVAIEPERDWDFLLDEARNK